MKKLTLSLLAASMIGGYASAETYTEGNWTLDIEGTTLNISHAGKAIFNNAYGVVRYNVMGETTDYTFNTAEGAAPKVTVENVSDEFGQGKSYVLSYQDDHAVMKHTFSFYPELPYMLTRVSVESTEGKTLQSNYMLALAVKQPSTPINAICRMVWVPFDNDGFTRFQAFKMENSEPVESHEVSYLFDGDSRQGLVAGSVDHDSWKSCVRIGGANGYRLETFELQSGFTNYFTRDGLPHGKVKGEKVSSARYFVGMFDDWREGMDLFGEANQKVVAPAPWTKGNPMGFSTWGMMQTKVNYDGVMDCAEFMKGLYDTGFHNNDGQTTISLDAFASDNITQAQMYNMGMKYWKDGTYKDGRETKEGSNQVLGQYCGHLVVWSWAMDGKIDGTGLNGEPDYYGRDIALKVNGQPYNTFSSGSSAMAVDPTHPAVEASVKSFLKKFASVGTKFIKVDFLNSGIIEGDSWYNPDITTGVQAYNYGMKLLYDEASKYDMYIVESIAPMFPYQYAHGRRVSCDTWGGIGSAEYIMNHMTYGWWTDKLYTVNDPDHLVMYGSGWSHGEARARVTSGMATGAFVFGDNFSDRCIGDDGKPVGNPAESRKLGLEFMGNADVNDYVRNHTGSFKPVDGHKASSGQQAEYSFVRRTDDYVYVALFNYDKIFSRNFDIELSRLGVTSDELDLNNVKELWTCEMLTLTGDKLAYKVGAKDAAVIRMALKNGSGSVEGIKADMGKGAELTAVRTGAKLFTLAGNAEVMSYTVHDLTGRLAGMGTGSALDLSDQQNGIYLLNCVLADGTTASLKIVNK